METRWELVLELSREPLEIDQICQLQKNVCLVKMNNLLIECFTEGCLDHELLWNIFQKLSKNGTRWDLVLELSREPLEIDHICQLQKNVCLVEEQSINRVFHSTMPGS